MAGHILIGSSRRVTRVRVISAKAETPREKLSLCLLIFSRKLQLVEVASHHESTEKEIGNVVPRESVSDDAEAAVSNWPSVQSNREAGSLVVAEKEEEEKGPVSKRSSEGEREREAFFSIQPSSSPLRKGGGGRYDDSV